MKPKISKKIGSGKDWDLEKNCQVGDKTLGKITHDFSQFEKSLDSATARVSPCGCELPFLPNFIELVKKNKKNMRGRV